ncbi:hypothetical protein JAAARDRAFT_175655 [Jaapia argillacea MUCL 33604]|uniref:MINDY deubiquitinase domain-containing protein n=1 Tax=Jaapia argillacea MUCL 33604 TaxID=933084 RepID=A0A067Q695_9AGAM|nr:hypothetical protein JAAARDRAFT_175655 [Jaapia argillacea MUCL 33604]
MSQKQVTRSSREDVWYLKEIHYGQGDARTPRRIITQNFNGPCSFIAICNILILRGDIQILPLDRTTVSYELLSQLVADYLLKNCSDVDISAALTYMPKTTKGMDLNPLFTGATSFRPAGSGGELKLFEQAGIKLVHGWLVDPDSLEYKVLSKTEDYDTSVNLLVEADHLSKGQLVMSDEETTWGAGASSPSSPTRVLTEEDMGKVQDAMVIRNFLDGTQSQLTYQGLFHLAQALDPGSLTALFRGSHLSVLYKSAGDDARLYTLVTDHVFLHEPSVVWERLEDVEGSASTFVDSDFLQSSPAGGDFAGHTAESALAAIEAQNYPPVDPEDQALARQLQAEEDQQAQEIYARRQLEHAERERQLQNIKRKSEKPTGLKKKPSCIIM